LATREPNKAQNESIGIASVTMTLIKWDALREIENLLDRYNRPSQWLPQRGQELLSTGEWCPTVDISETEQEFLIKAELPGLQKEDVKVNMKDNVLTIHGSRKQESEAKGHHYHRIERSYGNFLRSFTLPENIDTNKLKANFNDGILEIKIPKSETAINKSIEIAIN
jgi:HSP20 family protein